MEISTKIRFTPNMEPRPGFYIPWISENKDGFPVEIERGDIVMINNHINARGKWLVSTLFKLIQGLKSVSLDEPTKSVALVIDGYVSASNYSAISEVECALCSLDDDELKSTDYKSFLDEITRSSSVDRRRSIRDKNIRLAKAE